MMPSMIRRGAVLTIERVSDAGLVTRDGDGQWHRLRVGPAVGDHVHHTALAVGDRLLVERDAAPSGETLVSAPCGCSILMLAEPPS